MDRCIELTDHVSGASGDRRRVSANLVGKADNQGAEAGEIKSLPDGDVMRARADIRELVMSMRLVVAHDEVAQPVRLAVGDRLTTQPISRCGVSQVIDTVQVGLQDGHLVPVPAEILQERLQGCYVLL